MRRFFLTIIFWSVVVLGFGDQTLLGFVLGIIYSALFIHFQDADLNALRK